MSEFKGTPGAWEVRVEQITPGSNATCFTVATDDFDVVSPLLGIRCEDDAALIAAAPDLLEALLFAERRSKRGDEGHTEFFERLADEFHERHGYLPPGKDDPLRNVSFDEARDAWDRFLAEPAEARRAAIAKALGTTER